MARKKTNKAVSTSNELLLPSLALSMLVLMLVGVLVTKVGYQTPQTEVSARQNGRTLTKGQAVADLEADLLLLEEDNLDSEISVLNQIQ